MELNQRKWLWKSRNIPAINDSLCPSEARMHHNHTYCPACAAARRAAFQSILNAYGKVTAEEYELARKRFEDEEGQAPGSRRYDLAEEFDARLSQAGEFAVTYSCLCKRCGFKWEFKHEVAVALPAAQTQEAQGE